MKPLIRRGCKFPPRSALIELLAYISDKDPGADVGDRSLLVLTEEIVKVNSKNGRRARDMTFPIEWPADGCYEVIAQEPQAKLRYRPNGATVILPGVHVRSTDAELFTVSLNFPSTVPSSK